MSYLVLARKWRPRGFDELVGQEHVRRALTNALAQGRVHHAYLFTGTRGVGKTTIARILAKCLNCETGVSAEPCGTCGACQSIDQGRFMDLIEVDAASRTKVEDTRDLLENVQYAPASGRFKVYLIDEVHMLTNHSFNALLKTLEEPPLHAKFLLATTDPQKLPATVLSRCLQFNLKPMPATMINQHLANIAGRESIETEAEALQELAVAARGSMRDALSLMDQAVGMGGGRIDTENVALMLGSIARERVSEILQTLAAGDAQGVLDCIERLASNGADFEKLLSQLLTELHRLALGQVAPAILCDPAATDLRQLADVLHPEDIQLWYQIGLMGRKDLPYAPDPRAGIEMVLLRMLTFRPQRDTGTPAGPAPAAAARRDPVTPTAAPAPSTAEPPRVSAAAAAPVEPMPVASAPAPIAASEGQWTDIVKALPVSGMAQQLAYHSTLTRCAEGQVDLSLDPAYANLNTTSFSERLRAALSQYYGTSIRLQIEIGEAGGQSPAALAEQRQADRLAEARGALESDPFVTAMQDAFDARIDTASIRPPEESG